MNLRTLATLAACGTALAGCSTVANTIGRSYSTALTAGAEVPGPGEAGATGTAKITLDDTVGQICYVITEQGLSTTQTGAHIHKGAVGTEGPVVAALSPPVGGHVKDCVGADKSLVAAIEAAPQDYYVNVHDEAHPKGAIRGQLASR